MSGRYLINAMNRYTSTAVTFNLASLVCSIGIYLSIGAATSDAGTVERSREADAAEWRARRPSSAAVRGPVSRRTDAPSFVRYRVPVILICILTVWGSGDTISAWKYRHFAMIPNFKVEEAGSCTATEWDPDFRTSRMPNADLFRASRSVRRPLEGF